MINDLHDHDGSDDDDDLTYFIRALSIVAKIMIIRQNDSFLPKMRKK